ncbi:MAG: penicillin acylase family protein [Pseudomonadota bacterium]|uniref:penicillin acylase family protein n=1 Tax=Gallaecimonas pentaromativorans TaxID=584787 RepID=UPI000A52FDBD|nr:penicillin acylase family protein [Gallaecimonas pentaromativorans]MED5526424.1 penicillin acylase family protein [Pseudomonadota bacterium]
MKWRIGALILALLAVSPLAVMYFNTAKLDGTVKLPGLNAPVAVNRDNRGVPLILAKNQLDLAQTLGYLHAQDRFFQMDLLRRLSAGELAALVGDKALDHDRDIRRHRFRARAEAAISAMAPQDRALLVAYSNGVNKGLADLLTKPFEYWLLRQAPRQWRPEDSLLVIDSMYLDLQGNAAKREWSLAAISQRLDDQQKAFWFPFGGRFDAALDSTFPQPAPLPKTGWPDMQAPPASPAPEQAPGSNGWAVAGRFTNDGAAMLASDMHLSLRVPNIWYRMAARIGDNMEVGLTLPGTPALVVGSNGHIAWGFTNSYGDFSDLVVVSDAGNNQYQTSAGPKAFTDHPETIQSSSGHSETLVVKDTQWGPLMGALPDGRPYAQLWTAQQPGGVNINLMKLVDCPDVSCALALAPTMGIPTQNMMVADTRGNVAWTLAGPIPERLGYSGLAPVDLSQAGVSWQDRLPASAYPRRINPPSGRIWSANQRMLGGAELSRIGDGGYVLGERAGRIRDLLKSQNLWDEKGFFAMQYDNKAPVYDFWAKLLANELSQMPPSPDFVKARRLVDEWDGTAASGSQAFVMIHDFRQAMLGLVFAPFYNLDKTLPGFDAASIDNQWEYPLRQLLSQQPPAMLPKGYESWQGLLSEQTARQVTRTAEAGWPTWGSVHQSHIRHPLSAALPDWLARYLDAPVSPQSGDSYAVHVTGTAFGASERLVVTPGREDRGILVMPGGQSGNPFSPYYLSGHQDWQDGNPEPLMPQEARWQLTLTP